MNICSEFRIFLFSSLSVTSILRKKNKTVCIQIRLSKVFVYFLNTRWNQSFLALQVLTLKLLPTFFQYNHFDG